MITAAQLQQYESAGVVAASKALRLHTATIHRLAKQLGITFKTCTMAEQCRRERARKAMAMQLRPLARQRMTQKQMCAALGISRAVLRRTATENGIDINSRALY